MGFFFFLPSVSVDLASKSGLLWLTNKEVNCKKCVSLVCDTDGGGGCESAGVRSIGTLSVLYVQFYCECKTTLKNLFFRNLISYFRLIVYLPSFTILSCTC